MLFSKDRLLPANRELEGCVRDSLKDGTVDLFGEFPDAVRFTGPAHNDAGREYACDRKSHNGWLAKAPDESPKGGWTIVSMENDRNSVHPEP